MIATVRVETGAGARYSERCPWERGMQRASAPEGFCWLRTML